MTHIRVVELGHHWFRLGLVACSAPSHYLNQCWDIVNWTPRNKLQWNFNRNSYIFIQENRFENVVWKMAAILARPQCVKFVPIICLSSTPSPVWTRFRPYVIAPSICFLGITVTSDKCHGFSNEPQLDFLFNNLFRLTTTNKISAL